MCNFFDPEKTNTISVFGGSYSIATVIAGLILTVCVGLVIIGGLKRIAQVSQDVYKRQHSGSLTRWGINRFCLQREREWILWKRISVIFTPLKAVSR